MSEDDKFESRGSMGSQQSDAVSKRARGGSISGRLRTASDLEEIGLIDRNQKGVIKDLIISGDAALQSALDKYDRGDVKDLENIISTGVLNHRRQSIDLIDGLDLDFLNVQNTGDFDEIEFHMDPQYEESFRFRGLSDVGLGHDSKGSFDATNDNTFSYNSQYLHTKANGDSNNNNTNMSNKQFHNKPYQHYTGNYANHIQQSLDPLNNLPGSNQRYPPLYPSDNQPNHANTYNTLGNRTFSNNNNNNSNSTYVLQSGGLTSGGSSQYPYESDHGGSLGGEANEFDLNVASANNNNNNMNGGINTFNTGISIHDNMMRSTQNVNRNFLHEYGHSNSHINSFGYNYDQNDHIQLNNIHGNLTSHLQGISLPTHRPPPMTNPSSVPASSVMLGPIGAYSAEMRKERIDRFMEKRKKRVWTKKVKYDVRKNFADSRLRVKGRFVKKEDEEILRDLMTI